MRPKYLSCWKPASIVSGVSAELIGTRSASVHAVAVHATAVCT